MSRLLPHPDDTIAALASAPGSAARGIVRLSGPRVLNVLREWFVSQADPFRRRTAWATPGEIRVTGLGRPVPVDLLLWPTGRSYTGQPLAELHAPGSPPLLEAILADIHSRGVRPAQPGEFTLRAFLAGRIDLMQAEAVLGVIEAHDAGELRQALVQLDGGVSSHVVCLRGDLLDLLADLEAGLDFADEDLEFVSQATIVGRVGLARDATGELIRRAETRLRSVVRPRVVLAGLPNAGKSSLFNALAGHEAAIVSAEQGTTRDYLAAEMTIGSLTFTLIDTAGHESAADPIAGAAQQHSAEQRSGADLVLWCVAPDAPQPATVDSPPERTLLVHTKSDLREQVAETTDKTSPLPSALFSPSPSLPLSSSPGISVSVQTRAGLPHLTAAIATRLTAAPTGDGALLGTTAARCRDSLHGAADALDRALAIARRASDAELLAIELREALDELGKIVGAVYTDDILDRIFSKFCIGK